MICPQASLVKSQKVRLLKIAPRAKTLCNIIKLALIYLTHAEKISHPLEELCLQICFVLSSLFSNSFGRFQGLSEWAPINILIPDNLC